MFKRIDKILRHLISFIDEDVYNLEIEISTKDERIKQIINKYFNYITDKDNTGIYFNYSAMDKSTKKEFLKDIRNLKLNYVIYKPVLYKVIDNSLDNEDE